VQVGSHFHFLETNKALRFNRRLAYGKRLNIIAGTAVRFEPGELKTILLVDIGGARDVWGGNGLTSGHVDLDAKEHLDAVMSKLEAQGFGHADGEGPVELAESGGVATVPREKYAEIFGPTTGDRIRLGDTSLMIEVEHDHAFYGK